MTLAPTETAWAALVRALATQLRPAFDGRVARELAPVGMARPFCVIGWAGGGALNDRAGVAREGLAVRVLAFGEDAAAALGGARAIDVVLRDAGTLDVGPAWVVVAARPGAWVFRHEAAVTGARGVVVAGRVALVTLEAV